MQIEIHGLCVVIHNACEDDISKLCKILHLNIDSFTFNVYGNCKTWVYAFGDQKESVFIRHHTIEDHSYTRLNLDGSFLDHSPDFKLRKLLRFIYIFRHSIKQLDVAFTDDKKCLELKLLRYWCRNRKEYCTGSLVARRSAERVYGDDGLSRIQLGSARSTTNYGTIYRRKDTKLIRIEIKFKKEEKIRYLLEDYSSKNIEQFEARSKEALVSCINFVTPSSKRIGRLSKYVKQPSWRNFLGSDVKRLKWSEVYEARRNNRVVSVAESVNKKVLRAATIFGNIIKRFKSTHSEGTILNLFFKCLSKKGVRVNYRGRTRLS